MESVVEEFEGHNRNIETKNRKMMILTIIISYHYKKKKKKIKNNEATHARINDFSSKPCELYNFAIATVIMLFLDRDANT